VVCSLCSLDQGSLSKDPRGGRLVKSPVVAMCCVVEPILEWVREANRFKRIRINTVGFKQAGKSLRAFMRKLARQNNGEYKELR